MRRDGAVVDDASAHGPLILHDAEGRLRAEEGAGEVDVHRHLPLIEGQILERGLPGLAVGVVSDQELVWAKGYGVADTAEWLRWDNRDKRMPGILTELGVETELWALAPQACPPPSS